MMGTVGSFSLIRSKNLSRRVWTLRLFSCTDVTGQTGYVPYVKIIRILNVFFMVQSLCAFRNLSLYILHFAGLYILPLVVRLLLAM